MTGTTERLGEVSRDGEAVVLRYQRRLAHPPEKVWRALTESEHLRHWFPADIVGERAIGAPISLPFWPEAVEQAGEEIEASGLDPDDAVLPGEIRAWQPYDLFEFTWDTELLRFELSPTAAGTRLDVTVRAVEPGPRGFESNAAGYHVCLDALVATLDGEPLSPFHGERARELEAAYAARL